MNPFLLLLALRGYLEPKLAELPLAIRNRLDLPPKSGEPNPMRPARLFIGSMPPTANEALVAAPFVLLQPMSGHNDPDGLHIFSVALRMCIVADDYEAAENDLFNLLSQLRLWLSETPGGVIGGKFRLSPNCPLEWTRPDDQVHPFLQAFIMTEWQSRSAVKKPNLNMVDYE